MVDMTFTFFFEGCILLQNRSLNLAILHLADDCKISATYCFIVAYLYHVSTQIMDLNHDNCTNYCCLLVQQHYLAYRLHVIYGGNLLFSFWYGRCNSDDPEIMLSLPNYLECTGQSIGFLCIHEGNSYTVSFLW